MKTLLIIIGLCLFSNTYALDVSRLPPRAQEKVAEALRHIPAADHKFMRATDDGALLYVDEFNETDVFEPFMPAEFSGDVDPAIVFNLHSRPGSTNVFYLDFDGELIEDKAWNRVTCTNCVPKTVKPALPYDPAGDGADFSQSELNNVYHIWQRVVDSYAGFDVDITTERPTVWTNTTGSALITEPFDADGDCIYACSAGGVAFTRVFGTDQYFDKSPALVYASWHYDSPSWAAIVISHELGHNLWLSHHGQIKDDGTVLSYYGGHGSGLISWGPTMGSASTRSLNTWSRGEYAGANNTTQDDVARLTGLMGLIADDYADIPDLASPLPSHGIINHRNDQDWFFFDIAETSDITIRVTPSWINLDPALYPAPYRRHARLDVELALLDPDGVLTVYDDPEDTEANISLPAAQAGRYYLQVDGVGSINYTDYDSSGEYFITTNFGVVEPPPNEPPVAGFAYDQKIEKVAFSDTSTDDRNNIVSWSWDFGDGGTSTEQNPGHIYPLLPADYLVSLTVTDGEGLSDSITETVNVIPPPDYSITLDYTLNKNAGTKKGNDYTMALQWSGAVGDAVTIEGAVNITTENDGAYNLKVFRNEHGNAFRVCDAAVCSNTVTLDFKR